MPGMWFVFVLQNSRTVRGSSSLRHIALILDSYEAVPIYSCVKSVKEIQSSNPVQLKCHHLTKQGWEPVGKLPKPKPKPIGKVPVGELVAFFDGEKKTEVWAVGVLFG